VCIYTDIQYTNKCIHKSIEIHRQDTYTYICTIYMYYIHIIYIYIYYIHVFVYTHRSKYINNTHIYIYIFYTYLCIHTSIEMYRQKINI